LSFKEPAIQTKLICLMQLGH